MSDASEQVTDELISDAASMVATIELEAERRTAERHDYPHKVVVLLRSVDSSQPRPIPVQGVDISSGGLCVESKTIFRPGAVGVVQLKRSDGTHALVGVQVCRCTYTGDMMHQSGLRFIPAPEDLVKQFDKLVANS